MNDNSYSGQAPFPGRGRLPAKQERSRKTHDALVRAARRLMATRTFDSLSVADIAASAECSVGVFYQRFKDKDGLFRELIAAMIAETREGLLTLYRDHHGDRVIAELVKYAVANFRKNAGLLRAAIQKGMDDERFWQPIREYGHFAASLFVERLEQSQGRLSASRKIRIRFAFQMLYGMLINSLIHSPGPLKLNDDAFVIELTRAFRILLEDGHGPRRGP